MVTRRGLVEGFVVIVALGVACAARGQPVGAPAGPAELLAAWLEAEDRGDLPAYAALFDPDFGSSLGPAGRGPASLAGWLAGVAERFAVRARVHAGSVELVRLSGGAGARVEVTRASGDDGGGSVAWLWMVPTPSGWRIAGLDEVGARRSRRPKASDTADLPIRSVVLAGQPYVALFPARPEHVARERDPGLVEHEPGWMIRPADDLRDEPGVQRWLGRSVILHDAAGPVCRVATAGVVLLVRPPGASSPADPIAATFDLARSWAEAPGGASALVALSLAEPSAGDCPGARWAHLDDRAPVALPHGSVDPELQVRALAALRELPVYRAAGRLLRAESPSGSLGRSPRRSRATPWDRDPRAVVEACGFGPGPDGARYVALWACSPEGPGLGASAIWQVRGEAPGLIHLVLLSAPEPPARPFLPDVAVTWPGARDPAFLDGERLVASEGSRLLPWLDVSPPRYARTPRGGSTSGVASATLGPRPTPTPGADAAGRAPHERTARPP